MIPLLTDAIEAHGGLNRWKSHHALTATIVSGGDLWALKGVPQDPVARTMRVELHRQWASVAPFGTGRHTDFTSDRIAILAADGSLVAERSNPRSSFARHDLRTSWDPLHRAYFNGYALWTYLTTPFLLAMDGFEVEEIEPWREGAETWRGLRATFPAKIASHSSEQDFYFGEDMLIRRHDYHVDIAGSFPAAQYVTDPVNVDGIWIPTRRRAYLRGDELKPMLDTLMVSIDLSDFRFG
ncbi:hypothetical protein [Bradyrhizobium sp. LVM 105]|uniref:hypothetical protein n=1 Tax=Bradyrhizobium sp. LVM 105 TaxID=2341115 RepID=UPI000F806358|nr:hypothetical protein [Bradyrhizobium sp. LVM 105]RTE89487.1 hypothetical protein D6B98_30240 [Bradyrhizobium sp. LVM 105]